MEALRYPPHITLAVYDEISEDRLSNAMTSVFDGRPALRLTFQKIRYFEKPRLVFWAEPQDSKRLQDIHAAVHDIVDPAICHPHYQLGNWIPHCTLATAVTARNRHAAFALASQELEPFEVVFDRVDCLEFLPVRIIDSCPLTGVPSGP